MTTSMLMARIAGPVLMALAVYMLADRAGLAKMIDEIDRSRLLLVWGSVFNMILGLLMVNVLNVWAWNYQGLLTLLGWMTLLKGAAFLVMPNVLCRQVHVFRKMKSVWVVGAAVLLVMGAYLAWVGYLA